MFVYLKYIIHICFIFIIIIKARASSDDRWELEDDNEIAGLGDSTRTIGKAGFEGDQKREKECIKGEKISRRGQRNVTSLAPVKDRDPKRSHGERKDERQGLDTKE